MVSRARARVSWCGQRIMGHPVHKVDKQDSVTEEDVEYPGKI